MYLVRTHFTKNPIPYDQEYDNLSDAQMVAAKIIKEGIRHQPNETEWAYLPPHRISMVTVEKLK